MNQPPARFTLRQFTLAYAVQCESSAPDLSHFVLVHYVLRSGETYAIGLCDVNWKARAWAWRRYLPSALLIAREQLGVHLASWELFEPPRGVKLFGEQDTHWVRRRHRRARNAFLELRSAVRPTKGWLRAMEAVNLRPPMPYQAIPPKKKTEPE